MTKPIRTAASSPCVGLLLGAAATSQGAASVGISFVGRNATPADVLAPTDTAGVVPQNNWNNVFDDGTTFDGTTVPLFDSTGAFTGVQLVYNCSDSWSSDGPTVTGNDKMMKGIIKNNLTPGTITVSNLSSGTYDVYVYATDNGAGAEGNYSIGTVTNFIQVENSFPGTFTQCTGSSDGNYVLSDYALWPAVAAGANGTITLTVVRFDNGVGDGVGVAGLQVIPSAGASFPPNTQPCSVTQDPGSTLAVEGSSASFSVGTAGPCRFQWLKNGVAIAGATDSSYTIAAVALGDDGAKFSVMVSNNVNNVTSGAGTLSVDANVPPSLTQGFLKVEQYQNIGGNTGLQGITDLETAIAAGPPTTTFYVPGPDVPQTTPNIDNFGDRVWGWISPDVTSDYDLFIRSDDSSQLFINLNATASGTNTLPDVTTDSPIIEEDTCCNAFTDPSLGTSRTTQTPVHLEAGKMYGVIILFKEGGGNDYVQVAWRSTNDTTAPAVLKPIPAANCWTLASPAGQRVSISTPPQPITVIEGRRATFKVGVTTFPVTGLFGVEWLTNGTLVPNSSGSSFRFDPANLADNGKQISARVFTLRGVTNTSTALLTVLKDTFPPVPSVGTITTSDGTVEVGVGFDEDVNPAGLIAANFTLNGGTSSTFHVATNSLGTYNGVYFDVQGLALGQTYTVTVKNVADLKGNAIPAAGVNVSFTLGTMGWANTGTPIRPGQVVPVGAGGFDILNGGRQEWATYDEATIAYTIKTNDFDVKVQVVYAEPGSEWTRVGLQARNDLNVNEPTGDRNLADGSGTASAYAQTHVNPSQTLGSSGVWDPSDPVQPQNITPNNGHEQNQRLAKGAATTGWGSPATSPVYPDVWLRLARSGTTLHAWRSEDGETWTDQGTTTLTDQQNFMYVGPFLTVETGNIWGASDFDVWGAPFDPKFDRLFVAQFRNFGDTTASNPSLGALTIHLSGNSVTISWSGAGTLQSSALIGTSAAWSTVSGVTGTSYTTTASSAAAYYRLTQ